MRNPVSLSVFFPVYNEEENIAATVEQTIAALESSPFVDTFEVILIDDGSADRSGALAHQLSLRDRRIRVLHHGRNRGYGQALKTGITAARMDYVFFTDADLQFDIVEVNALLAHLDRYPVVIGYRSPRRDPAMRLLNAWGWNLLNRIFFGLRIRDIDCAFKLFRRDLIQELALSSEGAMISAEILIRLSRSGVPVKEIPVSHLPRIHGSPTGAKLSVIARAFREMLRLYRGELGLASAHQELLKFMMVGVVNTLIDVGLYFALTRYTFLFSVHLVAAKFFSFLGGTISSLYLNRSWTFGIKDELTAQEVLRFYSMVSLSIGLDVALMALLVSAGMYDLFALVLTTGFVFLANFTISKLWVFRPRTEEEAPYRMPLITSDPLPLDGSVSEE